ncbi:MAG: lysophospholipase [Bdellovibrionales bacterium]|nr:lysophospholipase [Bdellovibrionales bacterium]
MEVLRHEYNINGVSGSRLFMQSWRAETQDSKGCVVITHGMAEHSECYHDLATDLAENGWWVFAWDLQGHGKSQGKRGYISDFSEFRKDLLKVVKHLKNHSEIPTTPMHLIGHSMGGLITLGALLEETMPAIQSAVLSSPALGVAIEVPKIKHMASLWLNHLWPTLTMDNEIRYEILSRDPAMMDVYKRDPLRHTKVSAPLYLGMMEEMQRIKNSADRFTTPLFFQIAGDDRLVDAQASIDFFKKLPGPKKLKIYEKSYHEIYNDINKEETIDDLLTFLAE